MAKAKGEIIIDVEKCKGCELCIDTCPEDVIALSENINQKGYRYAVSTNTNCTGCASCSTICPDAVITVYRKIEK